MEMTLEELLAKAFEEKLEVFADAGDGEAQACASVEEVMDIINNSSEPHLYINDEWMEVFPNEDPADKIGDFDRDGWLESHLG